MFKYEDMMCCSTCFEEMLPFLEDDNGNTISYICPNCGKIADITDEL